jgi:hypothetical protein
MARRTFGWLGLVALLSGSAIAADTNGGDFARRGWYLGGGGTYAVEQLDTGNVQAGNSGGVKLLGGYRAHPRFGTELDVDYLHGFAVHDSRSGTASLRGVATTLNGKGYLATGRVQPYGVAGVGGLYVTGLDASLQNLLGANGGLVTRLGGGMDLYATDHVVVNAEATYDLGAGNVSSLRFVPVTLGAQYRF